MNWNYAAAGLLAAAAFAIYNEGQKRRAAPVYFVKRLAGGYSARTVPPFGIFMRESERGNAALLDHENTHWRQYQKSGLIEFYRRYASELAQYGYDAMPMELEARHAESEYCKANYTECVRSGRALTVFNPNFRT